MVKKKNQNARKEGKMAIFNVKINVPFDAMRFD